MALIVMFRRLQFGSTRAYILDACKSSLRPLVERLKQSGLRPTRPAARARALLLADGDRHVTAEQLHGEAHAADVRVSLATIYNTLHQFTKAGLLREVVVDSGRSYFDTNTSDHHHFFHEQGGQLEIFPATRFAWRNCRHHLPARRSAAST